jgi:DNA primase catalytic core
MSEVKDLLDYHIYPKLDRAEALEGLEPRDKGSYYLLVCPACGRREAYIYKTGLYIKCNRMDKCAYSISLWDYIQQKRGLTNQETLQELARLAHYSLPELEGYSHESADRARKKANILEAALEFFKAELWSEGGKETLEYLLQKRGYQGDEVKEMELGFNPGEKATLSFLAQRGYALGEITENLKYLPWREDYRLVIPWRDPVGRLKSLWGRLVRRLKEGEKESDKYKPITEAEKGTLFHLHTAIGQKEIRLVEGFLDTLIANARGVKGVVALGGDHLSKDQIENVRRYGSIREVTLCLDGDEAGQKGIERNLSLLSREGITTFVAELPPGYDPDDLIRERGIAAFEEAIHKAISAAKWKAKRLAARHDLTTDKGKYEAIEEALAFEETLPDPLEAKDFIETVTTLLGIPAQCLQARVQDYHDKKARERIYKAYRELLQKSQSLLEEGQLTKLRDYIEEQSKGIRAQDVSRAIAAYTLSDLTQELAGSKEGMKTGFPSLDKLITLPEEAITVIAGRPSHGKTTFLLNLLLNMVKLYPDKTFFFFSYEETKKQLALKVVNILSGVAIHEAQNLNALRYYLLGDNSRVDREQGEAVEAGKAQFKEFTEEKRLWLIDEPYCLDELKSTLCYLAEKYTIGAIFVDYIQKIKTKGKYATRQLQIQDISATLLELAKSLRLTVIVGAQLGRDKDRADKVRLDNLREAGDIEQDANLVLGIYNEAMEKSQEQSTEVTARVVDLEITILKNRNGLVNDSVRLEFDRPILTVREKANTSQNPKNDKNWP